ncbi:Conserved_hypothetical protein [Hexamita inflata]|uniref:Transmembrane protein n=1 Tax=Hexamita inflata TaxID=28002 RepID=A0AA86U0X8_9EUKA|nr:Conserved hypothetical protein [Hexamita inflata]
MINEVGATEQMAKMTIEIFDFSLNDTVRVTKTILSELLNGVGGQLQVIFDCSILGQECTNTFNAFETNYIYKVDIKLTYQTKQRVFNSKTYNAVYYASIDQIVSGNYPQCYTSIYGTIQPTGVIIGLTINQLAACTPGVQYDSVEMVLGISGKTTNYIITNTIDFTFSDTQFLIKCKNQECNDKLTILSNDPSASALFQINFLNAQKQIVKYFMNTAYAYPFCFSQMTAQITNEEVCLIPQLATDTTTCEILIPKRVPIHIKISNNIETLVDISMFDVIGATQPKICVPCPNCGINLDTILSSYQAGQLRSSIMLQTTYYFIDKIEIQKIVKAEYIAASICSGLVVVVIIIISIMFVRM